MRRILLKGKDGEGLYKNGILTETMFLLFLCEQTQAKVKKFWGKFITNGRAFILLIYNLGSFIYFANYQ